MSGARSNSRDGNGSGSGTESETSSVSEFSQNSRTEAAASSTFDMDDWHCEQQLTLVSAATLHDRAPLALGLLSALHAVSGLKL